MGLGKGQEYNTTLPVCLIAHAYPFSPKIPISNRLLASPLKPPERSCQSIERPRGSCERSRKGSECPRERSDRSRESFESS